MNELPIQLRTLVTTGVEAPPEGFGPMTRRQLLVILAATIPEMSWPLPALTDDAQP
jgi:hypothetical protein